MPDKEEFLNRETARRDSPGERNDGAPVGGKKRRIPCVRLSPRIIRFHLEAVREALDAPHRAHSHPLLPDDAQLSFDDLAS